MNYLKKRASNHKAKIIKEEKDRLDIIDNLEISSRHKIALIDKYCAFSDKFNMFEYHKFKFVKKDFIYEVDKIKEILSVIKLLENMSVIGFEPMTI